jgi:hypothetical protein
MKALYAPLEAVGEWAPGEVNAHALTMKMRNVFKPDRGDLDHLVRRCAAGQRAEISLSVGAARG